MDFQDELQCAGVPDMSKVIYKTWGNWKNTPFKVVMMLHVPPCYLRPLSLGKTRHCILRKLKQPLGEIHRAKN